MMKSFRIIILFLAIGFSGKRVLAQLVVGENGWTTILPSADSKIVYVSYSDGDNNNDGNSQRTAVKTIEQGASMLRNGYPDHLLLKRGDTWVLGAGLGAFLSGRSATEPMVVGYYGEKGNRPLIKTDKPLVHVSNLKRSHLAFIGLELYAYKHDPNSPDYESEKGISGISFINASGENLLIEDCKFNYVQMGAYTTGRKNGGEGNLKNFKFRRNIIIHSWAGDSYNIHELRTRVQGMFIFGVDGILIEENLFDHNGWDEQIEDAGATMFNHNIYMSTQNPGPEKIIIRRNILARASAHGLQLRSGGLVEDNLFVQNAINLNVGYHKNTSLPGAFAIVRDNVFQEVRLMDSLNTEYPRSKAARGIGEITIPATIENNILSHCINEAQVGIDKYDRKWGFGGSLEEKNNVVYKWTNKNDKPKSEWPDPERTIASYHKLQGGDSSTVSFLLKAANRPLRTWWDKYEASSVNEYIRGGFVDRSDQQGWRAMFNGKSLPPYRHYLGKPDASIDIPGFKRDNNGNYLEGLGTADPLKVYSVDTIDGEPVIRISGQVIGGLLLADSISNYHLKLKFKWGDIKWDWMEGRPKDGGILYHRGRPGRHELQIHEGDVGSYWAKNVMLDVPGKFTKEIPNSIQRAKPYLLELVSTLHDTMLIFDPVAPLHHFDGKTGFTDWQIAIASPYNENTHGQWNTLEVICYDNHAVHLINGKVNMVLLNSYRRRKDGVITPMTSGSLALQSEGAELFFKDIYIKDLFETPAVIQQYLKSKGE